MRWRFWRPIAPAISPARSSTSTAASIWTKVHLGLTMKRKNLKPKFNWQRWRSEADDLAALPKRVAARMLFDVLLINRFELALLELKGSDAVWGPVHTSVGQEATAAATVARPEPRGQVRGHLPLAPPVPGQGRCSTGCPPTGTPPRRRCRRKGWRWCAAPWRRSWDWRPATAAGAAAPCTCATRRRVPRLQRHRRRRGTAGRRRGLRRAAHRQRQRGSGLRRRRCPASGRSARSAEHGRALGACR